MNKMLPTLLLLVISSFASLAQQSNPLLYRVMDEQTGNTRFAEFRNPYMNQQEFMDWLRKEEGISLDIKFIQYKSETDELGITHVRFSQEYHGLPVHFATLIIHIKNGFVESWNGNYFHGKGMNVGELKTEQGKSEILSHYALTEAQLHHPLTTEAGYCPVEGSSVAIPCFLAEIESEISNIYEQIWWDADLKRPIKTIPMHISMDSAGRASTHYIGQQQITADYVSANKFRLRETGNRNVSTFNGTVNNDYTDTDNNWNDPNIKIAGDVHKGAELVHDFIKDYFGRDSYGNNGDTLISILTAGSGNAFWSLANNTATFLVGSSGGVGPCASIDVVGHEYGHGICDESAKLLYSGTACALHESYADINGHMIEFYRDSAKANWYLGEEVWTSSNGIRNMQDPHLFKNPKALGGQYYPNGCHGSGGVQNFWFYLMVAGDTGVNEFSYSYALPGLGHRKAAQITYRSIFYYLIPQSEFKDALLGTLKAAKDLYGSCSDELNHTYQAWKAVNVDDKSVVTVDLSHGISAPAQVCNGAPSQVEFKSVGDKSRTVLWEINHKDTSSTLNWTYTFNKTGYFHVKLSTRTCDKVFQDSMVIAINMNPSPTFTMPFDTSCHSKDTAVFINTTVNKDVLPMEYEWYVEPLDAYFKTKDLKVVFNENLSYNIYLKAYYPGGCWERISKPLVVINAVKPSFSILRNTCQGKAVKVVNQTDTSQIPLKFTWIYPGNKQIQGFHPGDQTIGNFGYQPVVLKAEMNGRNCADTAMKWVDIYRNPEPDFTHDNLCSGSSSVLYNKGKYYAEKDWFMWHLGYANPYNQDSISFDVMDSSTRWIGLTLSDKRGCNATIYKTLSVQKLDVKMSAGSVCLGDSTPFNFDINAGQAYTLKWASGEFGHSANQTGNYLYKKAGTYQSDLEVTTNVCKRKVQIPVTVKQKITPIFTGDAICAGDSSVFTNNTHNDASVNYLWKVDEKAMSQSRNFRSKLGSGSAGTFRIKLVANHTDGCKDSAELMHTINPLPDCGYAITRNPEDGNNSFVFIPVAKNQKKYAWDFGDGYTSDQESPIHNYPVNGNFYTRLNIESQQGCKCNSDQMIQAIHLGIGDVDQASTVYPNPFDDYIVIPESGWVYKLISLDGKVIRTGVSTTDHQKLELVDVVPGVYWLQYKSESESGSIKLVKLGKE